MQSKEWVCSHLFAGIAGLNPASERDICLFECCVVKYMSPQQANPSFREFLLSVVCNTECDQVQQ